MSPKTTTGKTTPANNEPAHADLLARLAEARGAVEQWAERLAQAEADLAGLDHLDPAVVNNPDKVPQIAAERAQSRELVSVYRQTLEAAQIGAQAALSHALVGEAAALASAEAAAQAEVDRYDARVADLVAQLREHTGREWVKVDPYRDRMPGAVVAVPAEKSDAMVRALRNVQAQRRALLVAAEGGDPTTVCPMDELPAALQVDGYAPCQAVLARQEWEQQRAGEEAEMAAQAVELAVACRVLGFEPLKLGAAWDRNTQEEQREFRADAERTAAMTRGMVYDADALETVAALGSRKDSLMVLETLQDRAQTVESDAA